MSIKVYIVFIQEIWVQIYGYFWVQSLCLLGACLWLGWVQSMRKLGASLWILLSHPITVSQCYVMDEDAAPEAQAPEGSSPEGELTGKPYSSNSIAGTNS